MWEPILLSSRSADLTDLGAGAFGNVPLVQCIIPTAFPAFNAEEWGVDIGIYLRLQDTLESGKLTWQNPFCCKSFLLGFVCIPDKIHCLQSTSLLLHNDRSRWFAICNGLSPTFAVPILVLWVGLKKQKNKTNLRGEKYFCKVTYWAPLELWLLLGPISLNWNGPCH